MTESEFFTVLIDTLKAGFTARSIAGVTIDQGAQPRMQGAATGLFLLLWKVSWHPYGYPKSFAAWVPSDPPTDPPTGSMVQTSTQIYEARIQITGQAKQPPQPADLLPYTAGDLLKIAGRILQTPAGLKQLREGGLGVERLMQIPQSYFKDDSDQFAQSPNFDLIFTFTDVETVTGPVISEFDLKVYPI